ncbi:Rqc2 family fibronectin-binding protein [Oceanivirga salmonicida]|uniref:Rqc2 family fibronectin-binding protein n=1 Tax=Oceanivirga salmonicida TaxID=1769291 RepID=UPI0012E25AF0|nr:NFACT family protein [Oceanivirga salmonicida]
MIYLDAVGYKFLVEEIKNEILNLKIRKIQSYDNSSFSILFNKKTLYFENKKEAILYLKDNKTQNVEKELNFVLKLKKHIIGGLIKDIYLHNDDRIIVVEIEKLNLLNEIKKYKLIYEFLGKGINVVLLDEKNIILTSMYASINSDRSMIYGANYEYPENRGKYGNLMQKLDEKTKERFSNSYEAIIYEGKLLTYNEFYPEKEKTKYNSLNEAINEYYKMNNNISQLETKRKPLLKLIRRNIKRLKNILDKIPIDIEKNKGYEKYKIIGDILASNLYNMKNNMEKVELFDYYNNKNIEIELDKNLSPSKNMKKYYDRYSKSKRREESLLIRLNEIKDELSYYEEQELYTINQDDILGLEQIEKELGLNNKKVKSTKHSKREIQKIEYKDFEIYVGRNSLENEEITFKIARNGDLWFHAKNVAGSHVILRGKEPQDIDIEHAARLAAKNSKLNGIGEVDYCNVKNVKKIAGSKRGNVIYDNYKTIIIKG